MSGYAKEIIKKIYDDSVKESSEEYSTVTVRLPPDYGLMLKGISNGLEFPVLTAFTDIIPKHLFDLLVSLSEEDFNEVTKSLKDTIIFGRNSAAGQLRENDLIPAFDIGKLFKHP